MKKALPAFHYLPLRLSAWVVSAAVIVASVSPAAMAASVCGTPLVSPSTANDVVSKSYAAWKQAYVVSAGSNLRVQRSAADSFDTVSEGIAYGMLFAAYSNDKSTFDGLWHYAQAHVNGNGLMNWRIAADGTTTGYNGATDADEDMAAALIAADTQWGGYKTDALKQIGLLKKYEVEAGSNVLKPGDAWGGSTLLNPSYLTPSYYDVFASYTGDTAWNIVKTASYKILNAISTTTDSKTTGYIPDWSQANGAPASGMGYDYGYDGSRSPLRVALSSNWTCDENAESLLRPLNATNQTLTLGSLASSYSLNGTPTGSGSGTPLLAAAVTAATVSSSASYRTNSWTALASTPANDYFTDSMRLFGLFVAGGVFVNPLSLPAVTPIVTAIPAPAASVYALSGTNATATIGTASSIAVSATAPTAVSGAIVDVEIYDASGTRVLQKFFENQSLSGQPATYTVPFTPTKTGTYSVRGGIFSSGWASNRVWNSAVSTVTVSAASVTPPVVTPAPTTTPAPVATTPSPVTVTPPTPTSPSQPLPATASLSLWWPGDGQKVSGVQPFKAVLDGTSLNDYSLYWQVDGGTLNKMDNSTVDAPHKESLVDLSPWNWRSSQAYTITFVAKSTTGSVLAQKSAVITVIH